MPELDSDPIRFAKRAAAWANHPLSDQAIDQLRAYGEWLQREAIPAGGLGPREAARLWPRHLADSISFAAGWESPPLEILDVGSGVGLPGVPLSILWPETTVTLLDRGGRRVRLLRRAARVLALPDVVVAQGDVFSVADEFAGMVFRGSVKAAEAVGLASRILAEESVAVLGLSRQATPPDRTNDLIAIGQAMGMQVDLRQVPSEVLDGPAWLLIMRS